MLWNNTRIDRIRIKVNMKMHLVNLQNFKANMLHLLSSILELELETLKMKKNCKNRVKFTD